ncbi:hypothetical protein QA612_19520 [Evansella sp. AB-P1]|uniref:hypothetical protein n=1 Tax=Evansella sp. AB-P1 TaxID=3037653 RepID=UPI00241F39ED|nr:hypothetical protein [Evansella sp. AB-P1]MDG5789650.1 hypothetical protein [Evansella sp. AB-P1]
MVKDAIIILLLFQIGLLYVFYSSNLVHSNPYFIVATYIVITSIGLFFIFLSKLSKVWFRRLVIVNIAVIIFIPLLEGFDWIGISILYLVFITFLFIGYSTYEKRTK